MLKKIILTLLICLVALTGCSNENNKIEKDLENQMASIREGDILINDFDIYNRLHIHDSIINLKGLNVNINKIFSDMSYSVKQIKHNDEIAQVTLLLTVKDIDTILSEESLITDLIIEYENYVKETKDNDKINVDKHLILYLIELINSSKETVNIETNATLYYSDKTSTWELSFDEEFLNSLLGDMKIDYSINFDDIYENNEINIDYDYDKILNLPLSNKTTRSNIQYPIALYETAYFDNSDYFFEEEQYELSMSILEISRGQDALKKIKEASVFNNKEISEKQEYVLFKVNVKLENNLSSKLKIKIEDNDFSLLDKNGHYYNNCIIFGLENFAEIAKGESTQGYVCFIVDKNIDLFLLFKEYMNNTLCFSDQ